MKKIGAGCFVRHHKWGVILECHTKLDALRHLSDWSRSESKDCDLDVFLYWTHYGSVTAPLFYSFLWLVGVVLTFNFTTYFAWQIVGDFCLRNCSLEIRQSRIWTYFCHCNAWNLFLWLSGIIFSAHFPCNDGLL